MVALNLTRRATLIAAAGATALLASTRSWGQSNEPSDAPTVRVGVVKVTGVTPIYTAIKLGYFRDEGLNVETTVIRSGTEAQSAVAAGQLEFIPLNIASFIYGLHEGFDFKVAADSFRAPITPPGTAAHGNNPGPRSGSEVGTGINHYGVFDPEELPGP